MERIKQAVERARVERLNREGQDAPAARPKPPIQNRAPDAERAPTLAPRPVEVSWPALYERRVVGGPEANALVDTYRVLRTQVLQRMSEREARTLGITSANPGEGKSLTAVNLAISLAKKVPVLLLDADLRRPSIHRFFEIELGKGLAECLRGDGNLEDCIFTPGIEGLTILPGGAPTMSSSELLVSPAMLALVESLKRSAPEGLIIVDLPPLLTADDTLAFAPHVDAALLVVEEGRTAPAELARAKDLLKDTHLLGTVMNKSTQPHQAYYYRPRE